MTEGSYSIRSVQRVCDILDLVQARPEGLSLIDISSATDMPKSSTFRYLSTLEARGYVERDEAGDFRMGISMSGDRLTTLSRRLMPQLLRLRDEFDETINLGILDGSRIAYLETVESRRSIRNAPRPGEREYIHSTALGKMLACSQSTELVEAILRKEGMIKMTENTIIDVSCYLAELEITRSRGYALDDQENEIGGRCIAVPIPGSKLPVAISLSTPIARLPLEDVEQVAQTMRAVIGEASEFADTAH